ncbi:MAG: MFS transporter [Eggerthellales bacterium]|nr:MFS transporter [Eggerthellales bacterium]
MEESTQQITSAQRMRIFVTLVTTCVALALLSTALNTALPPLMADLGISAGVGQWAVSGYACAMAVATPLTAFLSTRFPTRPLYLCALGLFLVGTFASALAPVFGVLMVGRVVQACANALIANVTQVSIMSMFPKSERGRAMGWFGLATSAAPIAAPALGGIVVDLAGWRWVFGCVGLICCVSFAAALVVMRNVLQTAPKPFDPVSFVLSLMAFGGLTIGLGNVVALGLASPVVWGALAFGLVTAVFFVRRQLVSSQPFLKVQIMAVRDFRVAVAASVLLYAVMMGAAAVLPLHIQGALGQSATLSGLVVLPGAACTAAVSPVAGRLFDRFGVRALLLVGGVLSAVSCALMCLPALAASLPALCVLNALRCTAVGMLTMPLMTWGNGAVPSMDMPHASALLTSLRNLAGALGVAIFVGVFAVFGLMPCFVALAVASALISLCALGAAALRP